MTGVEDTREVCPSWCAADLRVRAGDGQRFVIHHGPSVGVRVGDGRAGWRVTPTWSTFYAEHDGEAVPVLVDVEATDQDDGELDGAPAGSVSMLLDLAEVDRLVDALAAARAVAR